MSILHESLSSPPTSFPWLKNKNHNILSDPNLWYFNVWFFFFFFIYGKYVLNFLPPLTKLEKNIMLIYPIISFVMGVLTYNTKTTEISYDVLHYCNFDKAINGFLCLVYFFQNHSLSWMIYTVHLRLLHDPMHNQSSHTGAPFSSSNNAFPTQVINWMPLMVNLWTPNLPWNRSDLCNCTFWISCCRHSWKS